VQRGDDPVAGPEHLLGNGNTGGLIAVPRVAMNEREVDGQRNEAYQQTVQYSSVFFVLSRQRIGFCSGSDEDFRTSPFIQ